MAQEITFFRKNEKLKLDAKGVWWSDGEEITHEKTIDVFHRQITQDHDGTYKIVVATEEKEVEVEGTPCFVESVTGTAVEGFRVTLLGGYSEILKAETLKWEGEGILTAEVRRAPTMKARFLTASYHQILGSLEEGKAGYFLTVQGRAIQLKKK